MNLPIESNALYEPFWTTKKRYVISIGGRGGARSFEASQKIVANLVQSKRLFRAAIMRAVHTDIRHSIWQECKDRVDAWSIESVVHIADSVMEMSFGKNSIHAHGFKRSSTERTAKLKSLAGYTHAFIEEGEEVHEPDFQQLDDSLRAEGSQIHIMLNTPPKSHWLVKRWFNAIPVDDAPGFYHLELKPEFAHQVEVIFSDHSENFYLAAEVHERYEGYRLTKPSYYWHMIRGLSPETVMGRIYKGWREVPEVPHEARLIGYGLDFGFNPDPAAIVAVYYHNGGYILDEKLYARGYTNDDLARTFKLLPTAVIIGDSAEPKSIEEMKRLSVYVTPCQKGKDSVNFGIKHVQDIKRISYTASSKNLKDEYENYVWKRTKDSTDEEDHLGIEDPKCENHTMSAVRYFLTEMAKVDADPEADERREHQTDRDRRNALSTAQEDAGL